ncbi:MAG: prepilin-type N-terminal cleavage/methylation domain-containing protein [Deltaproteobacteria bacterium]|nr:prepilin-type N-terminal cleavage/methylation domain-containing protein [Deltaproteobacteria bacterium]
MTLIELMVVVAIIAIMAAVGTAYTSNRCPAALSEYTRLIAGELSAARSSARANSWNVVFWFGYECDGAGGIKPNNRAYVRVVDRNGNLQIDADEACTTTSLNTAGCNSSRWIEFGSPNGTGPNDGVAHVPEADGVNFEIPSAPDPANAVAFGGGGLVNQVTPLTDALFLRIMNEGVPLDYMGRSIVMRQNGRTVVYGFENGTWEIYMK